METSIEESIKIYGKKIDDLLKEIIPQDRDDYLSEPIWHHLRTGGKRIRPAICLITCKELGGNQDEALHFALAIEILHNMFLLHDDIEDEDTMRRDQPTVWVKYGIANASNSGDYLLARAYTRFSQVRHHRQKIEVFRGFYINIRKTVEGQALDINARGVRDFTVKNILTL